MGVSVWEYVCVCVREGESGCVGEREGECVCVCDESVCVVSECVCGVCMCAHYLLFSYLLLMSGREPRKLLSAERAGDNVCVEPGRGRNVYHTLPEKVCGWPHMQMF